MDNITLMHGRSVIQTPVPNGVRAVVLKYDKRLKECADCNMPTKFIITELTAVGQGQPLVWGWCGKCDIGG
jgi:hypothetical protein